MYVCIIDHEGTILVHQNLKAEPKSFQKCISPFLPDIAIAAECIFTWYWLADFCAMHQIPFVLGHALYMKAIHGSKTKNDRIDSQKIAALLRGGMLPQAYIYPAEMRATRDLLRRRMHFSHLRSELISHIQNTKHQCNMPDFQRNISYKANRNNIVEKFHDPTIQKNVECDLQTVKILDRMIADMELYITHKVKEQNPNDFLILQSFPGIGKVLALVILYEIHDINRFPTVQDFASYARLIKPRKESAGKTYSGSNRKIGNRFLKWAFSEAAILLIRESDEIKKYHQKLKNKHGKAKALAVLAHRTGRTVYFMLKNKQAFDMKRFI
jgi:transposase